MTTELILYGVGRSGTTTLYNIIQTMLLSHFGEDVDFYYEPFLWSPDVFNKNARDITDEFSYMSSVSIDGVYANKRLPLLSIEDPESCFLNLDENIQNYLKRICIKSRNKSFLFVKVIRANGRVPLFNYLNPEIKNLFVLRNPLDVISSSIGMFSFYGTDFYISDYSRFYDEAVDVYGKFAKEFPVSSRVEQEAFYWYFSNKVFLDQMHNSLNTMFIAYDSYVSKKSEVIKSIGKFINIGVPSSTLEEADTKIGPITNGSRLDLEDFNALLFYHKKYIELIQEFFPNEKIDFDKIVTKHERGLQSKREENTNFGRTPLYIQNQIRRIEKKKAGHQKNKSKKFFAFLK